MFIGTAVLSGALALLFAAAGLGKLTGAAQQMDTARKLRIPWRRYRLIGIPEIAASVGLLTGLAVAPLGAAAAIGLALLMCGAAAARIRVHDTAPFVFGDAMFAALAGTTAVLRIATA